MADISETDKAILDEAMNEKTTTHAIMIINSAVVLCSVFILYESTPASDILYCIFLALEVLLWLFSEIGTRYLSKEEHRYIRFITSSSVTAFCVGVFAAFHTSALYFVYAAVSQLMIFPLCFALYSIVFLQMYDPANLEYSIVD